MVRKNELTPSPERVAITQWTARMGAVTAEALADHLEVTVASARGQLKVLERGGWISRRRPLSERPALYTATRVGLGRAAQQGLDPCRVSASNANHLIVCAWVAAALERCYPDHLVVGERELRRDERERGVPLASARLGVSPRGGPLLHRPDLVLWPRSSEGEGRLPIAVEVELTVKAPRRLTDICQAWARCRCVAGVLYLVSPEVERALHRSIEQAQAGQRIAVASLDALPASEAKLKSWGRPIERTVSSAA
jgi:Helix-turn-helix domain